jgi:hypothetical protein
MLRFILVFCFVSLASAQTKNERTVYKFGNEYLKKVEFEKLNPYRFYVIETKNDTIIIKEAFSRVFETTLDSVKFLQLKNHISKLTKQKYDPEKKALFHLYRGESKKANQIFINKKYWNYLKDGSQSFIVSSTEIKLKRNLKYHFHIDKNDILNKLFFKKSVFKINHLIISPSGDVKLIYGVEDILCLLDFIYS